MKRIQALQQQLQEHDMTQLLLCDPIAIQYLINRKFSCGERFLGLLVEPEGKPLLFLNQLFPCAESEVFDLLSYEDGTDVVTLVEKYLNKGMLAVDQALPARILLPLMNQRTAGNMQLGSFLVDGLRLRKEEAEQQAMRQASLLNDRIMEEVSSILKPGIVDYEVEEFILKKHRECHVQASFPSIVAFGDVASDPHGCACGRVLQEQDVAIIDMGLILDSYCSDMTRTFVFAQPDMTAIYEIVKQANLAAIAAVKPGVRFCDIDAAARNVIAEAGFGDYFVHRTGHGIGLDVHEPMDVSKVNTHPVEAGMCFSIEPGIYLPGIGGVRIEDLVIVQKHGAEVLNHFPK